MAYTVSVRPKGYVKGAEGLHGELEGEADGLLGEREADGEGAAGLCEVEADGLHGECEAEGLRDGEALHGELEGDGLRDGEAALHGELEGDAEVLHGEGEADPLPPWPFPLVALALEVSMAAISTTRSTIMTKRLLLPMFAGVFTMDGSLFGWCVLVRHTGLSAKSALGCCCC
jgi:hypothetical protein